MYGKEGKTFGAAKRVRARSFEENSNAFVGVTAYGEEKSRGLYVTAQFDACQIDFSLGVRRVGNESLDARETLAVCDRFRSNSQKFVEVIRGCSSRTR